MRMVRAKKAHLPVGFVMNPRSSMDRAALSYKFTSDG